MVCSLWFFDLAFPPGVQSLYPMGSSSRFKTVMSRFWKTALFGLIVGALGAVSSNTLPGLRLEETNSLPWMFHLRDPIQPPPEAVVIGIDRRASLELGNSPNTALWPRSTHARLIDNLVDRGVSAIVLDIAFLESRPPEEDDALSAAIARAERVVLLE